MKRGRPGVVSVGNRREFPREQWGWKDYEDEANMLASLPKLDVKPVYQPDVLAPPGFTLFPERRPRHDARSPYVTALLKNLGVR